MAGLDDAAEAGAEAAGHRPLDRDLDGRFAADPVRLARVAERAEHRLGTAGEDLIGPAHVVRDEVGDEAVVAAAAVVGGDDVLDGAGQLIGGEQAGLAGRRPSGR